MSPDPRVANPNFSTMETDEDFHLIIPLIEKFCQETNSILWRAIAECVAPFYSPTTSIVVIGWKDHIPVAYACAMQTYPQTFTITQGYSTLPHSATRLGFMYIIARLTHLGAKRIEMMTTFDPVKFARLYPFKLDRHLLVLDR